MLLQSLRALCKPPGGAGSIWKYLEAVVSATGVSGRYAYGFRTELHFDDVGQRPLLRCALRASGGSSKIDCQLSDIQATLSCRQQNSKDAFRRT
jgi:hypothetical protein